MGPFEWMLPKLYARWRKLHLRRYKHKKVKETKFFPERSYHIKFKLKMRDKHLTQDCGEFEIVIPATGIFFAKMKLQDHLEQMVSAEVIEFDIIEDQSSSPSELSGPSDQSS